MRSKLEDRKGNQEQFLIGKNPVGWWIEKRKKKLGRKVTEI